MRFLKIILLAALLYLTPQISSSNSENVSISKGNSAYAYHMKKSCRALKRCVEEGHVITVTLSKAKEMVRRPSKICFK